MAHINSCCFSFVMRGAKIHPVALLQNFRRCPEHHRSRASTGLKALSAHCRKGAILAADPHGKQNRSFHIIKLTFFPGLAHSVVFANR
ncbi:MULTISPECIES: hypothetical protein [Serratia]|uniref:hypothetical protein n=1 Tax=Serratia TaxID=613 RepID=UPI001319DA7F|nr:MULTISPECIES: hypothetical protein [Serratia]MEB6337876.1 hypothetical protein [Serratia rhizosphaerae]